MRFAALSQDHEMNVCALRQGEDRVRYTRPSRNYVMRVINVCGVKPAPLRYGGDATGDVCVRDDVIRESIE